VGTDGRISVPGSVDVSYRSRRLSAVCIQPPHPGLHGVNTGFYGNKHIFSIGYTAIVKEHVIVDLFILRLPPRGRDIASCITTFISFVFFALIAWRSVLQILISYKAGTTFAAVRLSEWIFIIFVLIGFIILALVTLLQFLQYLGKWTGKWTQ
jgi:TRAP-type mannitol/chloroaromatic compound transport system permease small subunit